MAFATFVPVIAPSPGSASRPELRLNEVEFGDGYTLASPIGLNPVRDVLSLKWDALTLDQITSLRSFFETQAGFQPFWYQPYSYTAPRKWICKEWAASYGQPHTFTATLRQTFILGV